MVKQKWNNIDLKFLRLYNRNKWNISFFVMLLYEIQNGKVKEVKQMRKVVENGKKNNDDFCLFRVK